MVMNGPRRSFGNGFVCFLLLLCAACGEDPPAGGASPRPREALPEAAIVLPEYYGLYAVQTGKTVPLTQRDRLSNRVLQIENNYKLTSGGGKRLPSAFFDNVDPELLPIVNPKTEFMFFDRRVALGIEMPRVLCPDNEDALQVVESRTKPVTGKPEMVRIVPVTELPLGPCGLWTDDEQFYMVEVGDQTSAAKRIDAFKKRRAISNLKGISTTCLIWGNEHGSHFPSDLWALVESGDLTAIQVLSPFETSERLTLGRQYKFGKSQKFDPSYEYIAGQTSAADKRNVLAFEKPSLHEGRGAYVVFLDGRVEFLDSAALAKALEETKARLNQQSAGNP